MLYALDMETKPCTGCGIDKPLSDFSPNGKRLRSRCKPCNAVQARKWAKDNPERHRDTRMAWQLRNVYKIEPEDYDRMLSEQGGVCAICGQVETKAHGRTGTEFRLAVDHDHETGRVRGLLCQGCNRGIGLLDDSVERLRKAADYLERGSGSH